MQYITVHALEMYGSAVSAVQRSAVQCSAALYGAVQFSAVRFIELDGKIKPGLFLTEEIIIVPFFLLV